MIFSRTFKIILLRIGRLCGSFSSEKQSRFFKLAHVGLFATFAERVDVSCSPVCPLGLCSGFCEFCVNVVLGVRTHDVRTNLPVPAPVNEIRSVHRRMVFFHYHGGGNSLGLPCNFEWIEYCVLTCSFLWNIPCPSPCLFCPLSLLLLASFCAMAHQEMIFQITSLTAFYHPSHPYVNYCPAVLVTSKAENHYCDWDRLVCAWIPHSVSLPAHSQRMFLVLVCHTVLVEIVNIQYWMLIHLACRWTSDM